MLRSAEIAGTTNDAELLRAASKGYIDENDALDLNRPITKRECAKMLGKLWNLTAPSAPGSRSPTFPQATRITASSPLWSRPA